MVRILCYFTNNISELFINYIQQANEILVNGFFPLNVVSLSYVVSRLEPHVTLLVREGRLRVAESRLKILILKEVFENRHILESVFCPCQLNYFCCQ